MIESIATVKWAIIARLQKIKIENGYHNDLPDGHVIGRYDADIVVDTRDSLYPKAMVIIDSGKTFPQPSEQFHKTRRFIIFIFVKKLQGVSDVNDLIESFIEDVEKTIDTDSGLNGTVNSAFVTEFITDGGVLGDEGCALITVETLQTSV